MKDKFSLRVGNEESVSAEAVGEAYLAFENKYLLFDNVFYILNINKKLIFVSELHKQLFAILSNNNEIVISRNGLCICSVILEFGLYVLYLIEPCNFNI